jgi:hypothetical protein
MWGGFNDVNGNMPMWCLSLSRISWAREDWLRKIEEEHEWKKNGFWSDRSEGPYPELKDKIMLYGQLWVVGYRGIWFNWMEEP